MKEIQVLLSGIAAGEKYPEIVVASAPTSYNYDTLVVVLDATNSEVD